MRAARATSAKSMSLSQTRKANSQPAESTLPTHLHRQLEGISPKSRSRRRQANGIHPATDPRPCRRRRHAPRTPTATNGLRTLGLDLIFLPTCLQFLRPATPLPAHGHCLSRSFTLVPDMTTPMAARCTQPRSTSSRYPARGLTHPHRLPNPVIPLRHSPGLSRASSPHFLLTHYETTHLPQSPACALP